MEDAEFQRLTDELAGLASILGNPSAAFEVLRVNLTTIHEAIVGNEKAARLDSLAAVLLFLRQAAPDEPFLGEALSLLYTDLATENMKKPPRSWGILTKAAAIMDVLERHGVFDDAIPTIAKLLREQKVPLGRSKGGQYLEARDDRALRNLLKNFRNNVQDRRLQRRFRYEVEHYNTWIGVLRRMGPVTAEQLVAPLVGELAAAMRRRPYRPTKKDAG